MEIEMNASVQNEHIRDIEHLNRTMKERIWLVYTELIKLYGRIPGFLVRKLVYTMKFCLNRFPAKYGISATFSPRAIITGQSVKLTKHFLI